MTTTAPEKDPLEVFESTPAVSFHPPNGGHEMGEWARLKVTDWPQLLQQRDDDNQPEFWDEEKTQPKLVLVVSVEEDGEKKSLWAKRMGKKWPDSLFQKIASAQKEVRETIGDPDYRLGPNDILAVKWSDNDTTKPKVKGNYPKKYEVKIKPGTRPATNADPFADETPKQGKAAPAAASEDPWGNDGDGTSGAEPISKPTQVGGDPFGPADADDEPPF